jgi:hypothetical protein
VRFPFTFMGVLALAMGVWVVAYVITHQALDAASRSLALGTAVVCFAFGLYVLVRRARRGPQH